MPGSADQDRLDMRLRDTTGEDPDRGFVTNPGELIAGTLVPSIEQGVAPLTAFGGHAPVAFDLSGAASRSALSSGSVARSRC
jgi:hypothetical protein